MLLDDAAPGDISVWRNGELLLDNITVADAIVAISAAPVLAKNAQAPPGAIRQYMRQFGI